MRSKELELLPTAEEQEWLLEALSGLIASRGAGPFVAMPIVLPTPEYFPDPWAFSPEGLDRVTRRLMQYAGLGDLEVKIETQSRYEGTRDLRSAPAGEFHVIEGGVCSFHFNEFAPPEREYTAGVMAHEVAHAYRAHFGIATTPYSSREEELLTDVTATYLGFALLCAYVSDYATVVRGALRPYHSAVLRMGYLSPPAFTFALALQMRTRDLDEEEVRRILLLLPANQRAWARAAIQEVESRRQDLIPRLRLPERTTWPAPEPLERILVPLPPFRSEARDPARATADEEDPYPTPDHVFRLRRTREGLYGGLFCLFGGVLGGIASWLWLGSVLGVLASLPGLALGVYLGRRWRSNVCSDPACAARLTSDDVACPSCKRAIVGTIERPMERFDAEDEYQRRQRMTERKSAGRMSPREPPRPLP